MSETEFSKGEQTQENNTKVKSGKRWVYALCSILLALLFFFLGWAAHWLSLGERIRSLIWAIDTAEEHYYREVDEDALFEDLFAAFALDPYSEYYTKAEYDAVYSANQGNGSGIGVSLTTENGKLRVFRTSGNSPAEQAGLLSGMYIHAFGTAENALEAGSSAALVSLVQEQPTGGEIFLQASFQEEDPEAPVYKIVKGDYAVSECLYRDSETAMRFDYGHGYAEIAQEAIGGLTILPADTAYVRVDAFYGKAAKELEYCLNYMNARGRTHLILDLRSNGGGYLSVFQSMAALLMRNAEDTKPLAATAKYRSGKVTKYTAPANRFAEFFAVDAKIYVLADERTASASECLIGALVSYGTTEYGDIFLRKQEDGTARTYGKGIMQTPYTDMYGNVLKLTSAEILWPNGKSIHGVGVTEKDGAIGISSPLLPGEEDVFLTEAIREILGRSS